MRAKKINEDVKVSPGKGKEVRIRIDKSTLPKHEQKVSWMINDVGWKNGIFLSDEGDEGMFYNDRNGDFDFAWHVEKWKSDE